LSILFEKAPLTDFLGGTERSLIDPTVIDECIEDKIIVNAETAHHHLDISNRRRRNAVLGTFGNLVDAALVAGTISGHSNTNHDVAHEQIPSIICISFTACTLLSSCGHTAIAAL
jgi:hypothetical protein